MARSKDRREKRKSLARRRAEQHTTGFETSILRLPDGLSFFDWKEGVYEVAVVPFVAGKGNPIAEEGELYYERTFFKYRNVGPEERDYVAPGKTFGKKDFIQEEKARLAKEGRNDEAKALNPKERQLFLFYNVEDPKTGLQLLEQSFYAFGKLLDSRIKKSKESQGWDMFYFPDEEGMNLSITIEEEDGGDFKWLKCTAIDFVARDEPLPEEIVNHGYCLDDFLICPSYDELKNAFLGISPDEVSADDDDQENDPDVVEETEKAETEEKSKAKKEKKEKPKKEKVDDTPTAEEAGLEIGSEVIYQGDECTIAKISKDGTSLKLIDSDGDPVDEVVGVADVKAAKKKEETEEASFDEDEVVKEEEGDDEDEWDF